MNSLRFDLSTNEGATRYGGRFTIIELADGRECKVHCDYYQTTPSGALEIYGAFRSEGELPKEDPRILLALPSGSWTAVYGASCWDGSPVAIEGFVGKAAA